MVHFRSKALDSTILNIYHGSVRLKPPPTKWVAYLLNIDAVTGAAEYQTGTHRFSKTSGLLTDLLLIFLGEIDKMIILCADEERNRSLVETSALSVPFFDAVERRLSRQVEHEQNGNGVIAHERKHVDELPLATQIPYRKGNFSIAY